MNNLVITGSTGFIGSHLLEELLRKKLFNIFVLKRSTSNTWRINSFLNKVKVYNSDYKSLNQLFSNNKIDLVIHLAHSYIKQHSSLRDAQKLIESNIAFPASLLELVRQYKIKYFINTGSCFEYALSFKKLKESSPLKPYNLYGATKLAFQEILQHYAEKYQLKTLNFRLFPVYGSKDNKKLIHYLIENFSNENKIKMCPSKQRWNFTYVKDVVRAYVCGINYVQRMQNYYDDFNIGVDKAYSVRKVISTLEEISGSSGLVSYSKPYASNEIFYLNCNNSKAKSLLKWQPNYDLKMGLAETYKSL